MSRQIFRCENDSFVSSDNYRQEGPGNGAGYGSEPAGYPGSGESRGPGRDGFDRGGMMHGARGRGGMGGRGGLR